MEKTSQKLNFSLILFSKKTFFSSSNPVHSFSIVYNTNSKIVYPLEPNKSKSRGFAAIEHENR